MIRKPYLSAKEKELLLWIGICVTEWARVEHLLFRLTVDVLGTGPNRAAIVFRRHSTLGARIVLIDELVKSVLETTDPIQKNAHKSGIALSWDAICRDLYKHMELRNHLAHWPKVTNKNGDPVLYFSPSEILHKGKSNPEEEVDAEKMSLHYELVEQIQRKLKLFLPEFSLKVRSTEFVLKESLRKRAIKPQIS
jgi:hypothetical protein